MTAKLYARRDTESMGDLYIRHVEAMTAEGLHEKNRIAAELAHRDAEIGRLRAIVDKLPKTVDGVPITPGMTVWRRAAGQIPDRHEVFMVKAEHWVDERMIHFGPKSPVYSTPEAAAVAASPQEVPRGK